MSLLAPFLLFGLFVAGLVMMAVVFGALVIVVTTCLLPLVVSITAVARAIRAHLEARREARAHASSQG